MRAIMSLSDRIVVLNLGRKLAEGPPQEVANDPARDRGLSGRSRACIGGSGGADVSERVCCAVEALEAGYGDVQVLWGISLDVARGAHDHAGRRQRRRQDHEPARHHRQHPAARRPRAVRGRGRDPALRRTPRPRAAWCWCRKAASCSAT